MPPGDAREQPSLIAERGHPLWLGRNVECQDLLAAAVVANHQPSSMVEGYRGRLVQTWNRSAEVFPIGRNMSDGLAREDP